MNILIIGGSGLFGRKTVLHLLRDARISRVVSMDQVPLPEWIKRSTDFSREKYTFIRGDITHLEELLAAIKEYSINRLVNLAFILPGTVETNPRLGVKVNLLGMCNAFEAARLMGIQRVVYASSVGVYGPQEEYGDREVHEDDMLHPQSAYALAKQMSEMLAIQYSTLYDMQITGIRPPIGYGHGGKSPNVIKLFSDLISLPATGRSFKVDVDGKALYSLASADEVAAFITVLVTASGSPHPVYNIGGSPVSLKAVADVVQHLLPKARIDFGNQPQVLDSAGKGIPFRLSMARARQDYGFSLLSLEESVRIHINDARTEVGMGPL